MDCDVVALMPLKGVSTFDEGGVLADTDSLLIMETNKQANKARSEMLRAEAC